MKYLLLALISFIFAGCGGKSADDTTTTDLGETAQQIGDVMASIDEIGGTTGSIAYNENTFEKTFARLAPESNHETNKSNLFKFFQPDAQATAVACSTVDFGLCSSSAKTRTFSGCTVGSATFSGTVNLAWTGTSSSICNLANASDTITRIPNFTVTGRRGATLAVTKTGTFGQKLTWSSGSGSNKIFALRNDGINRKFTSTAATVLFDQTTTTSTDLIISGNLRTGRTITAGTLRVTNNLTGQTCDYIPSNVTWTASCNCPTSGTWNGSCVTSGVGTTSTVTITGCGAGSYTEGTTTSTLAFDRCGT
ncbi:MAG: hypothetical protein WA160_17040 [Pseudobdellovibrio sp.]